MQVDVAEMDKMVEQMMSRMLSKEFLSQPMRDMCSRYPTWLAANRDKITPAELANYEKQYGCFQVTPSSGHASMCMWNQLMRGCAYFGAENCC